MFDTQTRPVFTYMATRARLFLHSLALPATWPLKTGVFAFLTHHRARDFVLLLLFLDSP